MNKDLKKSFFLQKMTLKKLLDKHR